MLNEDFSSYIYLGKREMVGNIMKGLIVTCLFSFVAAWLISCADTSAKPEIGTTSDGGMSITQVIIALAEKKDFEFLIQSNGKIRATYEQFLSSETGGKVIICNGKTGKRVSAGEVILKFETTSNQYRLQKAKLTQFNSQKEYESELLGYENLLKGKAKEDADTIRQKLRISSGLAGAEQEVQEANYELSKAVIKAPFAGILADVKVHQGQQIKTGEELFRIYDPYNLLLEVKVLEADISLLKIGTPAELSPVSDPELKYKANVYEINPYVDANGMVTTKLKIKNSDPQVHSLFPGMNCIATIKVPVSKTLTVPKEAVVIRRGKAVVFTMEYGKAIWNYVTVGRENGKEVEIKEGLRAGVKVITSNNLQLAHDAPVEELRKEKNH